jgi:hypothetical protein
VGTTTISGAKRLEIICTALCAFAKNTGASSLERAVRELAELAQIKLDDDEIRLYCEGKKSL